MATACLLLSLILHRDDEAEKRTSSPPRPAAANGSGGAADSAAVAAAAAGGGRVSPIPGGPPARKPSAGLQAIMAQLSLSGGTDEQIAAAAAATGGGSAPSTPERPRKRKNEDRAAQLASHSQQPQRPQPPPPPPGGEVVPRWPHVRALAYDESAVPDRTMAVCALAAAALVKARANAAPETLLSFAHFHLSLSPRYPMGAHILLGSRTIMNLDTYRK